MKKFGCASEAGTWAFNGALPANSAQSLCLQHKRDGYAQGTKTRNNECADNEYRIPTLTMAELSDKVSALSPGSTGPVRFDVLSIDCEGCAVKYADWFEEQLKHDITSVYLEDDGNVEGVSYAEFLQKLTGLGFKQAYAKNCGVDNHYHYIYKRERPSSDSNFLDEGAESSLMRKASPRDIVTAIDATGGSFVETAER